MRLSLDLLPEYDAPWPPVARPQAGHSSCNPARRRAAVGGVGRERERRDTQLARQNQLRLHPCVGLCPYHPSPGETPTPTTAKVEHHDEGPRPLGLHTRLRDIVSRTQSATVSVLSVLGDHPGRVLKRASERFHGRRAGVGRNSSLSTRLLAAASVARSPSAWARARAPSENDLPGDREVGRSAWSRDDQEDARRRARPCAADPWSAGSVARARGIRAPVGAGTRGAASCEAGRGSVVVVGQVDEQRRGSRRLRERSASASTSPRPPDARAALRARPAYVIDAVDGRGTPAPVPRGPWPAPRWRPWPRPRWARRTG